MNRNKGFVHILVLILVIVAIGLVGYFSWKNEVIRNEKAKLPTNQVYPNQPTHTAVLTPTIDPNPIPIDTSDTEDWNMYVNNKYGYSFRYPTPDKELVENDKYTDDLISIKGLDFEVIRIEPIETTETDPLVWWKTQKTETYTKLPPGCFDVKSESKIRSLYNYNQLVIDFKYPVVVLNNFYSKENSCHEDEAQIVLIPHKGRIIKVTHNFAMISEEILSTFKLIN